MRIIRKSLFSFISLLLISSLCSCGGGRSRHAAADTSDEQGEEQTESAKVKGSYSAAHPLELKLYMERSGSMVSFDTNQSSGDFKGIVSTLLNRFPTINSSDSTSVYIVNDNIYPYEGSVKDFLSQRDFFTATKEIGNPSYTDFDKIFSMILADMKTYQVSALVTDLIYSAKGQESISANKLLNEAYALTHNTFKGHTSNSVIVLKFSAGYNGPYYPYNSPLKGEQYNGERPFYVLLFASKESLRELYNSSSEYAPFTKFSTLANYEDMFCFTDVTFNPEFSIITKYDHEGRYTKDRSIKSALVTGIDDAQLSKEGKITIPIAVDLSEIPLSESYKRNKSLYDVESSTGFKITSIKAIGNIENADKIKDNFPGATHLITLESTEKPKNEKVSIRLNYQLPAWVGESSTTDDSNLSGDEFDSTTFGLEDMMRGIFAAYVPDGTQHSLFNLEFTIKKK